MDRYELRRLDYSLSEDHSRSAGGLPRVLQDALLRSKPCGRPRNPDSTRACGNGCAPWAQRRWRCPNPSGGDGATLVDLTLVAEEIGRSLAPVPWIDHVCAARLLAAPGRARTPTSSTASSSPHSIRSTDDASGIRLIPTGSIADHIVVRDGDDVVRLTFDTRPAKVDNIGRLPMAWVDPAPADSRTVLASGTRRVGGISTGAG